jgi:hypothetical protein
VVEVKDHFYQVQGRTTLYKQMPGRPDGFKELSMIAQETALFFILCSLLLVNLLVPYLYQKRAVAIRARQE